MHKRNRLIRMSFQIALVVLIGLGTVYAGVNNIVSPSRVLSVFYSVDINTLSDDLLVAIETQIRLLSGMWLAAGLFVIFSAKHFEANGNVLRLVFTGLSLGALGELLTVYLLDKSIQAALAKALFQVSICVAMEVWRVHIVKSIQN